MGEHHPDGDTFEVTVRAGDDTRTVAFAGRGRISGIPLTWVAEVHPDFTVSIHPTFAEDAPEGIGPLLDGMAHALSEAAAKAAETAAAAYRASFTETMGDIPVQRALFL